MNKILLMAALALSLHTFAQEQPVKPKRFAVYFGVSNSFFSENKPLGTMSFDSGVKPHFGVLYNIPLNHTISFRPKLGYAQFGENISHQYGPYQNSYSNFDIRLNYINASLDFKFWNRIYLLVGPQVGVLVNNTCNCDFEASKKAEVGVNLGVGFTVKDWFFELGGYSGLQPVIEYGDYWGNNELYNGHFKFTAGYHIF
ncbi:outer membrane beta-barrel protein [Flavobacterium sp.]|uniref:outer membrane beta-barrel protein n=1 Tax=Flavobacterium sp. TaxID=239 RepID=UPI0039E47513